MNKLKNIKSLKLTVGGHGKSLRSVIKFVVASWLNGGDTMDTENISLLFVDDFEKIDEGLRGKRPFIYLYPNRNDCRTWIPLTGFKEPIKVFGEKKYETFGLIYRISHVSEFIQYVMRENKDFLAEKRGEYNIVYIEPDPKFNDIWNEAYDLEFNTDPNNSFLCISFSGYMERH